MQKHEKLTTSDAGSDHGDCDKIKISSVSFLDLLPWEDVVFQHILTRLHLPEVFRLRAVNSQFLDCVTQYLTTCKSLNLTMVGPYFRAEAFQLVTRDAYCMQRLVLRHAKDWLVDSLLMPVFGVNCRLQHVDLTCCTSLTCASIEKVAVHCKGLQQLFLRDCHWLTNEGVLVVAFNCPQLEKLDIGGCWQVNNSAILTLAKFCKQLRYLSVAKIYGLTDVSIYKVAKNCRMLRHLNLQGCWRVTDEAIRVLGEHCKDLKMLHVRECRDITEISLARLRVKGVLVDLPQRPYRVNPDIIKYLQSLKPQV